MFLSRIRAGDDGDRSPFGNFWFSPVPFNSSTGNIDGETALRLTAVYRCVRLLSETVAQLPFKLYKPRSDGGRDYVTDHWLYNLLAVRPSEFQNPLQFRQLMQSHIELRGQSFARIYANSRGEITDLVPMHPDRTMIEMVSDSGWRYRYKKRDGTEEILNRGQVWHRYDLTFDGVTGVNPIAAARDSIATGIAAQSYGMRFFQNNAVPPAWVEMTRRFAKDEDRAIYRDELQKALSGRNQGKVAVFENGEKFQIAQISNADAQYLESKKFTVSEIARLYGVPPHKVGDLDRATNNNIEQQALEFVTDAIMPRVASWQASIVYDLLDPAEGLCVELCTDNLTRPASADRSNYLQKGIAAGWMTRNEARVSEGRNPLPGLDEPLRPLNMVEESDAEKQEQNGNGDAGAGGNGNSKDQVAARRHVSPAQRPSRLAALAQAAADRIARKETEMIARAQRSDHPESALADCYRRHGDFVAAALGVGADEANAYCDLQRTLAEENSQLSVEEFKTITLGRLLNLAAGVEE